MRISWLIAGLLIIGFGMGCGAVEPPVPAPPEALSVTAVLETYGARQRLLLTHVRPADAQENILTEDDLVQDAGVHIGGVRLQVRPVDSIDLRPRTRDQTYNYYSDALDVKPGDSYTLAIDYEGQTIRGQVVVPDTFRGDAEELRIFWRPSAGAARYRVIVRRYNEEVTQVQWRETYVAADTSVTVVPDEEFEPGRHWVVIQALDENLAAFQAGSTSQAGLEEAYGIFGAVTTIEGYVTLGTDLRAEPQQKTSDAASRTHPLHRRRSRR